MYGQKGDALMGNFNFTVGELTSQIKRESKMNIAHLGNDNEQNTFIWYYLTLAMWKYVGLIYKKRVSDPLVVASDGYVTFKVDDADIEDFYAPIRIYVGSENGKALVKRTSFEAQQGWFIESANDRMHIKGAGTYVLSYRAYPAKATSASQVLEWPAASYDLLMFETIGKIKESLNDLEGAAQAYTTADKLIPILVKANLDNSQSSTGGAVPSQNEVQYYRR